MKQTILVFSALIVALLVLFQISKYAMISGNLNIEIIISLIALVCFGIGVYINKKSLSKPNIKTNTIDYNKLEALNISKREYEVLQHINLGLSNKEIAAQLFVSESTIKTHVSNLLLKLNAKRRTQAIQIAKAENLLEN